jgi:hypothetical protein
VAPDESAVIVMGIDQEDPNLDQASFEADLLAGFTDHFGVRADAVVPLVVAGASIHAYEFHVTWDGDPTFVIFAPVVVDGKGYQIAALSMPGYEDDDRAAFRTFLNTVAFAG